jgi:hypothetical protein
MKYMLTEDKYLQQSTYICLMCLHIWSRLQTYICVSAAVYIQCIRLYICGEFYIQTYVCVCAEVYILMSVLYMYSSQHICVCICTVSEAVKYMFVYLLAAVYIQNLHTACMCGSLQTYVLYVQQSTYIHMAVEICTYFFVYMYIRLHTDFFICAEV